MFPQIFGKYVLERELASGGMARVFLATLRGAVGFEKRLVVKQIRPELASDQSFIRRFVAEAKTTVELSHANIVPVYELGTEQGIYYIAMEFCAGVSLAELLGAGPASPSEAAYIGVEICRALDYAHRKAGVVHRDVTPRNVMIDPEGMVRLIDFGIAAPASALASGEPAFGSPGHMPPEQLRAGPLTPAADVFAVAVLLVEAWTGRAPFRRESFQESQRALDEPRPKLGAAHAELEPLEPLIASALAHAASARPQTAEELARPLREFLRKDDLGDIARRLGQRVAERLRQAAHAAGRLDDTGSGAVAPPKALPEVGATPAERRHSGTQTFAVRDALLEWTARIESTAPRASSEALDGGVDTEFGVTAPNPRDRSDSARARRFRRRTFGAAFGSCALLALALLGQRFLAAGASMAPLAVPGVASPNPELRGGGEPVPVTRAAAPGDAERAPEAVLRRGASVDVQPPPPAASARNEAPRVPRVREAMSRGAMPAKVARLQLTADPPAWVELDAARIGRTPLMNHGSSSGRHTITFINQLLGEKLQTTVTLGPDSLTRVHADFTSANPRVYVR